MPHIPSFDQFMNPTLQALRQLGGSGTIEEIYSTVSELMNFTDAQLDVLHNPERSSQTEIEYRMAWARTYLKKYGLVNNSQRGVWALTPTGKEVQQVNPDNVKSYVRELDRARREEQHSIITDDEEPEFDPNEIWREQLMTCLLNMPFDAFERLIQRVLRESGFSQVEVTSRTRDHGIDGRGIMQIAGLMSFHVIFQCKRYKNSVGAPEIRNFRGAMSAAIDKGIFVTTSNFTKDAVREAKREGAPAIDLIDGDRLMDLLKELSLGIETKIVTVEEVSIDENWFESI